MANVNDLPGVLPVRVLDYDIVSCLGAGRDKHRDALFAGRSGLIENDFPGSPLKTWIGKVQGLDIPLPAALSDWESRNNRLIWKGLQQGSLLHTLDQVRARFPSSRIGVIVGSSTASIDRTEEAYSCLENDLSLAQPYRQPKVLNPHSPGEFIAHCLDLDGPCLTVSTACSSSAKVFASAARWLQSGIADAVLVAGADSLCLSVLHGFHSLQLISEQPCRPFDRQRDGINIGEAAGFAILTKDDAGLDDVGVALSGYGESSDAYHMSHPHPEGRGAHMVMEQALSRAGLQLDDVDYINLHGTATEANDKIEGALVARLFAGKAAHVSSTKAWTGHTLGAAGIVEGIFAMETIRHGFVPAALNLTELDEGVQLNVVSETQGKNVRHVLSNSFGFGGNNCCLAFSQLSHKKNT